MSGPNYDVTQVPDGYRIREPFQEGPGMLVTHEWLRKAGFGPLSRTNIEAVINATLFNAAGGTIAQLNPRDLGPRPFPKQFYIPKGLKT